jgi:hypothetical protein
VEYLAALQAIAEPSTMKHLFEIREILQAARATSPAAPRPDITRSDDQRQTGGPGSPGAPSASTQGVCNSTLMLATPKSLPSPLPLICRFSSDRASVSFAPEQKLKV